MNEFICWLWVIINIYWGLWIELMGNKNKIVRMFKFGFGKRVIVMWNLNLNFKFFNGENF